eukprot:TRINITY_DN111154_c0_g1_i1.p1 TRINITY_DN111154_c0_g1~~TRINITY_DN111154_c0_g1_i1.p1  ORF type:complete len:302 (-),score=62.83 TRINITY_DN111154_c0_g1_i1:549-1454(-)
MDLLLAAQASVRQGESCLQDSKMDVSKDFMFLDCEDDTQVPTSDSEQSDVSESTTAASTLSADVAVQRIPKQGGELDTTQPLMLALDRQSRVHVVQGVALISAETLSWSTREMENSMTGIVAKKVAPAKPPGTFFKPPPGLSKPDFAVKSKAETTEGLMEVVPQVSAFNVSTWILQARRLRSSNNVIISPRFEFTASCTVPFRVMLQPKDSSECRRTDGRNVKNSISFKASKGVGTVLIKSEELTPDIVSVRVKVGKEEVSVVHDFGKATICRLPGDWNFLENVVVAEQTIPISVDITKVA